MNKQRRKNREGGLFCSSECNRKNMKGFNRIGVSWGRKRAGINNPNFKHNLEVIKKAKILIKEGRRLVDISKELNLNQNYLSQIKNGRVWNDLII